MGNKIHVGEKSSFFRKEAREPFLCLVKHIIVVKEENNVKEKNNTARGLRLYQFTYVWHGRDVGVFVRFFRVYKHSLTQ